MNIVEFNNYMNYINYMIRKYMRTKSTIKPNKVQYIFLSYNTDVDNGINSITGIKSKSQMDRNAIYNLSADFRSHYNPVLHLHKFRNTECFYDLVNIYCTFDR